MSVRVACALVVAVPATNAWSLVGKWVQVDHAEKPKLHNRCALVDGVDFPKLTTEAIAAGNPAMVRLGRGLARRFEIGARGVLC